MSKSRTTTCTCSSCLDLSFSSGFPNKCFSELLEHSLSVWFCNLTRSNIRSSQCTTTRSRLDTTKRTSKSWTCSELKETSRSSSSHLTKMSRMQKNPNGSEVPTLFKSSKLTWWTKKEKLISNKTKRPRSLLPSKRNRAKMLKILWNWSDTWPPKTKSWRLESPHFRKTSDSHKIELKSSQLRLKCPPLEDHQSSQTWAVTMIKLHPKMQTLLIMEHHCQLDHLVTVAWGLMLVNNPRSNLQSIIKDGKCEEKARRYIL